MSKRGVSKEMCLEPKRPPPKLELLQKYVRWCILRPRQHPRHSTPVKVQTLLLYFNSFVEGYQRLTKTRLDKGVTEKIKEVYRPSTSS